MFVAPLRDARLRRQHRPTRGELEIARQELLKLRPHLQSIDSDNYPDTLRDGDAVLALAWNGTAYLMQQEADYKDTGYTVPSEGTIYWVDTWVLLAEAPHPNAAYAFLNWIQDPEHPGHREPVRRLRELQRRRRRRSCRPELRQQPGRLRARTTSCAKLSIATDQSGNKQRADIWAEFKPG